MSLTYYLYNLTKLGQLGKYRGFWRIRKLVQKRILARNTYFRAPYLGHSIFVCPNHSMGRKIFEGGIYEPAIIKSIQTFVKNGYSFVDIGANIGLHTLAAAFVRVHPDQVFISFEPDKDIFSVLERNCSLNVLDFVKCMQQGVGDQDTYLPLNISLTNNKGRSSFLNREDTSPSIPIKISTLDTLFLENEELTSKEILIKIDTEGYELPIVRGGVQWLSRLENSAIICEISPSTITQEYAITPKDLLELFTDCGFTKHAIYKDEETVLDLGSTSDQCNVVFYKGVLSEKVFSLIAPEFNWGVLESKFSFH